MIHDSIRETLPTIQGRIPILITLLLRDTTSIIAKTKSSSFWSLQKSKKDENAKKAELEQDVGDGKAKEWDVVGSRRGSRLLRRRIRWLGIKIWAFGVIWLQGKGRSDEGLTTQLMRWHWCVSLLLVPQCTKTFGLYYCFFTKFYMSFVFILEY